MLAMANTLVDGYGLDPLAARVRAAQIVATAVGWRVFEDYLVAAGELDAVPLETLREELVHSARRLGATRGRRRPTRCRAPAEVDARQGPWALAQLRGRIDDVYRCT